jgi:uncharacterized protein
MPLLLLPKSIITIELIAKIKAQYRLEWNGKHGIVHWSRVYENGFRLAQQEGVNSRVVQLFAVFHDSCRVNEDRDRNHGRRGAELAVKLRKYCPLNDAESDLLTTACEMHTNTLNHENITVQACFDSDRLDLGRVGHYPDSDRLCTPMAKKKKTIEWAYHRSLNDNELPDHPFGLDGFE